MHEQHTLLQYEEEKRKAKELKAKNIEGMFSAYSKIREDNNQVKDLNYSRTSFMNTVMQSSISTSKQSPRKDEPMNSSLSMYTRKLGTLAKKNRRLRIKMKEDIATSKD